MRYRMYKFKRLRVQAKAFGLDGEIFAKGELRFA
jgi:hypothetical protein